MTNKTGGIDYKIGHRLEKSDLYAAEKNSDVYIDLLVTDGVSNDGKSRATRVVAEAEHVARRIKAIIGTADIFDAKQGVTRKVRASDIAILMRAVKGSGSIFERALAREGIECVNNNPSEKYLDSPEVRQILAFLQVIDNPYDDIPLITLLYGDVFGFTASKLASIRACDKRASFYDALKKYADTDTQCAEFVVMLESLRKKAQTTDVYGIITAIFEKSGILIRNTDPSVNANLNLLLDIASEFESTRYRGLFAFINYIGKLIERDCTVPAASLKYSDDCVRIMSIHGSKGLEFPVVFVVNTDSPFYLDRQSDVVCDTEFGVGTFVRDNKTHRNFPSLYRNALKEVIDRADKDEYMRLLYVALTRAKNRLYITATETVAGITSQVIPAVITPYDIYKAPTFFKWMLMSLRQSHNLSKLCAFLGVDIQKPDRELVKLDIINITSEPVPVDEGEVEKPQKPLDPEYIKTMVLRRYEYENSTLLPKKMSVSEIKSIKATDRAVYKKHTVNKRPRFMSDSVKATDKGTATHTFLQYCDFNRITDMPSLERERERLLADNFISASDAELCEYDKILRFLRSDTMKNLIKDAKCEKEKRFLFTVGAKEVLGIDADERVIVQGIIDCYFVKDNKAVIIDYKTDKVENASALVERYKTQLDMYERALLEINGIATESRYIYSFHLEQFIKV